MVDEKFAKATKRHVPKTSIRIFFFVILVLILATIAEVVSRLGYSYKSEIVAAIPRLANLREYQVADPQHGGQWRLRPGFVENFTAAQEAAHREGRILGERHIANTLKSDSINPEDVFVRINKDGFRGPEIDKSHSRWRILTIGDSCTFGTSEVNNYSRSLERNLARLKRDVEVINGGVEGYAPSNVLFRIEEFRALEPELTTIYIGWNALFNEFQAFKLGQRPGITFYSLQLLRQVTGIFVDRQKAALAAYNRRKRPDPSAAELKALDSYEPAFFPEVERIVEEMERLPNRKVVLMTLPGLYTLDERPTERALQIGHLPLFTDNPYFLAKMAREYNAALRRLAARQQLLVIDLEAWSETALVPRDQYFIDSVHLTETGQEMIGAYMADQLQALIAQNETIGGTKSYR